MLSEFFQYGFLLRALVAGIAVACVAPVVGMFLVTRRYAFMADTLAHVSFAGIAAGMLLGLSPIPSAMVTSIVAAVCVDQLRSRGKASGESALALFLSGGLAVASVLLSLQRGGGANLQALLFGSIVTVTWYDAALIAGSGAVVLAIIILLYRPLLAVAFDEDLARAAGVPVGMLTSLLVVLAAVTVSLAMRVVGVLLVSALMVIPVLSAMQLRASFLRTTFVAVGLALTALLGGLAASVAWGTATGGSIVLVSILLFVLCAVLRPSR